MKKFLLSILAIATTLTLFSVAPVLADTSDIICENINNVPGIDQNCGAADAKGVLESIVQPIVNLLLFLIGAVAVIMLIIGGFRYVISGGDSEAIKGAKNTIIYAIIGIVIAFLSYAIVNFVVGELTPGSSATPNTTTEQVGPGGR
ncbi:MAG: hypothetical protein WDZ81_00215 [Candidatus Saccharimonadales bacterium]